MNAKELKKYMKPAQKQATIFLDDYIENEKDTTVTYHFKGQNKSHIKVDNWNKFAFEMDKKEDGYDVRIVKYPGLKVLINENGWKRLAKIEEEGESDE